MTKELAPLARRVRKPAVRLPASAVSADARLLLFRTK